MNYLKQIVAFDKWEELHPLSDKAYRLWFKLMAIANASGWDRWLSVPLLKLKSELHTNSDKTITDSRNALVQAGRLEVKKGKRGKSAEYRLIPFAEVSSKGINKDNNKGKDGSKDNDKDNSKGDSKDNNKDNSKDNCKGNSTTYSKQNKTKLNKNKRDIEKGEPSQSDARKPRIDPYRSQVDEVIAYLNERTGKQFRARSRENARVIGARLSEGFSVSDCKQVIDNKCADWLNDSKMAQYLRPATLFRASKFEGYLNETPKRQYQTAYQRQLADDAKDYPF